MTDTQTQTVTLTQLADSMLRAFASTREAEYQHGAYCAGSSTYSDHERVAANREAADRLRVDTWRTFYDLGSSIGDAARQLQAITDAIGDRDADDLLDPARVFELLSAVCEQLPAPAESPFTQIEVEL